jgi:SAM-dependent methyltransferase
MERTGGKSMLTMITKAPLRIFGSSLEGFFSANRRIARAITPKHVHEANVFGAYRKLGAMLMSHPRVEQVVDIGAGGQWQFPPHYKDWYRIRLIGLDIDRNEMTGNEVLDEKIECDVVNRVPFAPGSIDLFMVHSGIEHFSDTGQALRNLFVALRPGGFILAEFPNRFAHFAILNRLLPSRLSHWLLDHFLGGNEEMLGFKAYYNNTNYSSFKNMCDDIGFKQLYFLPGYYGSFYFEFFLPFYVCSYALDMLCFAMGVKNFASYYLWVLQKPDTPGSDQPFKFWAWD